jgi:2-dehydro-3-deoxyglucarate aldolase/4-hydroxy-2-oxoheptanedioate aldolase
MSHFLQQLAPGDGCKFGTWVKLGTLETLEMLAIAGFDFVVVDMEHAPHTLESAYRLVVAAQGFGMRALVRLPDSSGALVQRILDSGADGVLVPRVRTVSEAGSVADGMRFSPEGARGLGITSRAGHWGLRSTPDYVAEGNRDVLRGVQLEDAPALRDAASILAVEGINAAFVGPGDLALSTGQPAGHPDNAALIDGLLATCRELAMPCGTAVGDAAAAIAARERGFSFVMVSNDCTLFGKAAQALVRGIRG